MSNINRVQNIFIGNGTALPANNAALSTVTAGKIGIFGTDMTALDPAGNDTITTQPGIYIVEGRLDADGNTYVKRSNKIDAESVISYQGEPYRPAIREVWSIGHNRKTAAGTIEVTASTNYKFAIRFKNDKWNYSNRPEVFSVNFDSSAAATQLSIATQIAAAINNAAGWKKLVTAIVVGDGTGVYGVTGATDYGVEITAKDVEQFINTTYHANHVQFTVSVDDNSGFGTTTTCTQIQAPSFGSGTYNQVYALENKFLGNEGVVNRTLWPIPTQTYSASSSYFLSAAIAETVTGTISEDQVTFSADVSAKIRAGEKVDLNGVNYEIKYFISTTVAVLTSVLSGALAADAVKVRYQYDLVSIEFSNSITTPTGVVARSNEQVIVAVPAIDAAGNFDSTGAGATDVKDILDAWMTSTPRAFANITI